jgi:hypothetical protein
MGKQSLVNRIKADAMEAGQNRDRVKYILLQNLIVQLEKEKASHRLTQEIGLSDVQVHYYIKKYIESVKDDFKELLSPYLLTDEELVANIGYEIMQSGQIIGEALKGIAKRLGVEMGEEEAKRRLEENIQKMNAYINKK